MRILLLTLILVLISVPDVHADNCFVSFDVDPDKAVAVSPWLPPSEGGKLLSCSVVERLRTELFVNNPEYFTDVANLTVSEYFARLEVQIIESQKAVDELKVRAAASGTAGALLIATEVLLYEFGKYQTLLCLAPDVSVTKLACGAGLLATLIGSYDVLSGNIAKNDLIELSRDAEASLSAERSRLADLKNQLEIATADEIQSRVTSSFEALCQIVQNNCLK